ncbi:DUF4230 domain-containing protein [Fulvivirga maritima]|uniref:DUF4230 domain-containing protein n=1 Tax=Fulvivirga maritima TaxID=2904247 RepID=UPI001F314F34|nr:DUF4230 domain-containing protein [Fulvivirga maritima]UII25983.1 DUF4230 domain-containing protein [Fulvivirga maritima]
MSRFISILMISLTIYSCKQDKRTLVISKIQAASKLATTETVIDKTVVGTKTKRLLGLIKLNEANFVAYTEATVKTGIDLNKLTKDDIEINEKEISIHLPPVEVLDFSYPFQKFEIDSTILRDSWVNRFDILDYEEFYRQAEVDIRNQLQYTGIIEATQNRTRTLFQSLLKNLGYEAVFIEFSPTEALFQPIIMEDPK